MINVGFTAAKFSVGDGEVQVLSKDEIREIKDGPIQDIIPESISIVVGPIVVYDREY